MMLLIFRSEYLYLDKTVVVEKGAIGAGNVILRW
jgi:hypothetical protein